MIVTSIQTDQHTWVLGFSGKLNFQSRPVYHKAVNQAQAASPSQIIFDFTDLSYIDSAGLGLLAVTHRKLTGTGIKISLANGQESVKQLILLINMDRLFPLFDSVAAAIQQSKTSDFLHR